MRTRSKNVVIGLAAMAVLLAGCGGSSDAGDSSGAASPASSFPPCDLESLLAASNLDLPSDQTPAETLDSYSCDGQWAVAFPIQGGDHGIEYTDVYLAVDGTWVRQDRETVCGTIDVNAPAERPDDAQVPASIWTQSCATN